MSIQEQEQQVGVRQGSRFNEETVKHLGRVVSEIDSRLKQKEAAKLAAAKNRSSLRKSR